MGSFIQQLVSGTRRFCAAKCATTESPEDSHKLPDVAGGDNIRRVARKADEVTVMDIVNGLWTEG